MKRRLGQLIVMTLGLAGLAGTLAFARLARQLNRR